VRTTHECTSPTDTRARSNTNDADTCVDSANVTAHDPVPEHPPPDQPANTDPAAGDAVNTTTVPCKNHHEHPRSQLIPAGDDTTDP
jgi:hypothetical protein